VSEVQDELAIEVEKAIALENGVINWDRFREYKQMELWHLVALTCDFDPSMLNFGEVAGYRKITPPYNMLPAHILFTGIPVNKRKMFGDRLEIALENLGAFLPPAIPGKIYYHHLQNFDVQEFVKWIKTKRTWEVPLEFINMLKKHDKNNSTNYKISDAIKSQVLSEHCKKMAETRPSIKKSRATKQNTLDYFHQHRSKWKNKSEAADELYKLFDAEHRTILNWLYALN